MRARRAMAAWTAALALTATPALASAAPAATPIAAVAKTCSAGFVHATIGGSEKCLRAGEFCAHGYNRQYQHYGYRCTQRDRRGNYHLTYR